VATESEIVEIRRLMGKVSSQAAAVTHVTEDMVTVLNQTHKDLILNRDRINELTKRQEDVADFLERLSQSYFWAEHSVEELKVQVEVERILEDLELLSDAFLETVQLYHIPRADLEFGQLTESILPKPVLLDCLAQGQSSNNFMITPIEWYYRFSSVTPVWGDVKVMVFRVVLPLVSNSDFIRYSISSFPVPLDQGKLVQLHVNGAFVQIG
jgi:hypothetical protein